MLLIRLSSLVFMLMFTLLEARVSIYKQPHYQGILESQSKNIEAHGIHLTVVSKGIRPNVVHHVKKDGSKTRPNGRKLAFEGGFKKEKTKKKELTKMPVNSGRSSNKSGATPSSWKCNHKVKRKSDDDDDHHVLCKHNNVRRIPKKAMLPDGVALSTADYHFPNPHPPRHN